jgi:hypothetical protein
MEVTVKCKSREYLEFKSRRSHNRALYDSMNLDSAPISYYILMYVVVFMLEEYLPC